MAKRKKRAAKVASRARRIDRDELDDLLGGGVRVVRIRAIGYEHSATVGEVDLHLTLSTGAEVAFLRGRVVVTKYPAEVLSHRLGEKARGLTDADLHDEMG